MNVAANARGPAISATPTPAFAMALFGHSAREDIGRYNPSALVILAEYAWRHLVAPRQPGAHSISIFDPEGADPAYAGISVIEVVNDDMPFLLDSTLAELHVRGVEIKLVAHPIMGVARDEDGNALSVANNANGSPLARESLIHIHVERLQPEQHDAIIEGLDRVYRDVRACVTDWQAMRNRLAAAIARYRERPPSLPVNEIAEAVELLEWLAADNFTLLGMREYSLGEIGAAGGQVNLNAIGQSGLGLLRDPDVKVLRRGRELVNITPEVLEFLHEPHALIITKANVLSRVHRRAHMDYIGVKQFGDNGALIGELRVVGLFTATAYTRPASRIPYIRNKIARVIEQAAYDSQSHSGKTLGHVLETFPRDELFQIDAPTLTKFAQDIVSLYERPRLRVLARPDKFDRFVSVLTYIPRDRYDTRVRVKVGEYLARVYGGRVSASYPFYPEGMLVRTHYIIGRYEGATPVVAREELEAGVAAIVRTWDDTLRLTLADTPQAPREAGRYVSAFSAGYMEAFAAADAIADIAIMQGLSDEQPQAAKFYHADAEDVARLHLKIFSRGRSLPLSERVPILENMGFRVISERTFDISPTAGDSKISLHDMALERAAGGEIRIGELRPLLEETLLAVLSGAAESDGYNALTLEAAMPWRDAAMLRALSRYLRQANVTFGQSYMWQSLARNPAVTTKIVEFFYARFDPTVAADERTGRQSTLLAAIEDMLKRVASLDEDRILRKFVNLVQAAVRANFFQREPSGAPRACITFKFESRKIDDLPAPRPLYEISVYAPRVEGVHLRFGKVARGGLRWSDRAHDFRTEILGLAKAQQVKNAVIVPVGAKGGFFAKHLPVTGDRDAYQAEAIAAYKMFVGALLDLTDNLDHDGIVAPKDTVRYEGDDPYLVVAADKGTATFSDIANGLALEHGYWLDDAFASGGSAGYDHKKMGITARGAWEAVKRHFREMDMDIQTTRFTVAGVGDMSGDVFGNAMLLSPHIKLVAAFDHRDIFIDPEPDIAASLAERARMFTLPRSSWRDFDATIISQGGGVFSRAAKEIELSAHARALLGLTAERATPQEIIRAILKSQIDLLWFGGIGTYVCAADETNEDVNDRANDALRVNADELRCRVIGEGANLGVTQRGRIAAATRGVRLNTDAIDNSAGVNTSDIEVNIKIALAAPMRTGVIDVAGRNTLLASMTEDVGALVLRNNYQQTLALSLAERRGADEVRASIRLMQSLERDGRLDRSVEFLADDATFEARAKAGRGMTRPELSVLLAYAKLAMHEALLASDVPDDPWLSRELVRYFPRPLVERFPEAIARHRLRREIVVTGLVNAIVNRAGPTIATRIADETGADAPQLARAFAVARDAFSLTELNAEIDTLDGRIPGQLQLQLYAGVQDLLLSCLVWFTRHGEFSQGLEAAAARFRGGVQQLQGNLDTLLPAAMRATIDVRARGLQSQGAPEAIARRIACLPALAAAPDIVLIAESAQRNFAEVASTFFAVDEKFGVSALLAGAARIEIADRYDGLARDRAMTSIETSHRRIAALVAQERTAAAAEALEAWIARLEPSRKSLAETIQQAASGGLTLSKLTVLAGTLGDLARP